MALVLLWLSLVLLATLLPCFLPRWLRRRPQDVPLLLLAFSLLAAVMAYAYPLLRTEGIIFEQQCAFALFIFLVVAFHWAKHRVVQGICLVLGMVAIVWLGYRIEALREFTERFQSFYSWTGCFVLALLSFLAALGAVWGWRWFREGGEAGTPLDLPELHRRGIISKLELEKALDKGRERAA
jgi:hypothetical protein